MILPRPILPAALAVAALLQGCAGSVASYPSLVPRPIEQAADAPAPAPVPAAVDPALAGQAAAFVADARKGDAAFAAAVREGCAAIGRGIGAAEGGEMWIGAQQALSAVEAARGPTVDVLDTLDALVLDRARAAETAGKPVDLAPLLAAAQEVEALDTAQRARLSDLRASGCRP